MPDRRGYINFYSLYIAWLMSAVFIHLPSFQSLGLDVRADVSMLLVTFLVTLLTLGLMHGAPCQPHILAQLCTAQATVVRGATRLPQDCRVAVGLRSGSCGTTVPGPS